jgi:hypothetical protein
MAFLPTNPDGSPTGGITGAPDTGTPDQPAATTTTGDQIKADYQKYLGRQPGQFANGTADPGEAGSYVWDAWKNMDPASAEAAIKGSAEAQQYAKTGQGANAQLPGTGGTTNPANAAPYSGGAPPIASSQGTNPQLTQLRNMLLARAGQSLTVDPNDPTIKAQTDAYAADVTRGGRDFLSQQAESAGPINNMDAAYRSVGEKAGQAVADRRGQLMQGVVDARRKEISDALSGLGGTLSLEEQTRLRQEDQDLARQRFGADTAQQTFDNNYKTIFG